MAPEKRTIVLLKLRLAAILAVMLLTPALAALFLDDWDDLRRLGWRLLLAYLYIVCGMASVCGFLLYRLALRPASPARLALDRALAVICVADSSLTLLILRHPHDAARASQLLIFITVSVALSLWGLYWPLDTQPPQHAAQRRRLARRLRRSLALVFAVAPLPLAIWLVHGDWLRASLGSLTSSVPELALFSLLVSVGVGMQWSTRTLTQPTRVATSDSDAMTAAPATVPAVEGRVPMAEAVVSVASLQGPPDTQTGLRGVLVSRTCATSRLGMDGDLWLFPDGLLRIPLGWRKTLTYVGNFYDTRRPLVRTFITSDFLHAITDPQNLWIARNDITSARLRRGIYFGELRVLLNDGHWQHLLWQSTPATDRCLHTALKEWLGERLEADAKLYGQASIRPSE